MEIVLSLYILKMLEHIFLFCETNDNGDVKDITLCDTMKAYMKGQIISY